MKQGKFIYISLTIFLLANLGVVAQIKSYKRGISYSIPSAGDVKALSDGLTWYYNWGHTPPDDTEILEAIDTYKLDFIPMTWGRTINKEQLREFYQKNPQIKYILGFNEPNFLEQANIGPKEAASRWHEIEEIADEFNLKIVGPAMNYAPNNGAVIEDGVTYSDPFEYLDAFFEACEDCRIDYVAAHCYMNYTSALKWYINQYKKYNRPIWLTEFCAWENNVTLDWQKTYLAETLNYLESDPDIYRYAWFIGRTGKTGEYPYMQLLDKYAGELTDLGKMYVNMSSFDKTLYYKINEEVAAKDYIEASDNLHLDISTDESGILTLADFYADQWVVYNLEVEEDGEYFFRCRVATQFGGKLQILSTDESLAEIEIPVTGGLSAWQTFEEKINLKKGQHKIKIQSKDARVNLNWWMMSDQSISSLDEKGGEMIRVYPNPVKEILYISGFDGGEVQLSDCVGKELLKKDNIDHLNVSELPSGIYFLTLKNKLSNLLATYKIIK